MTKAILCPSQVDQDHQPLEEATDQDPKWTYGNLPDMTAVHIWANPRSDWYFTNVAKGIQRRLDKLGRCIVGQVNSPSYSCWKSPHQAAVPRMVLSVTKMRLLSSILHQMCCEITRTTSSDVKRGNISCFTLKRGFPCTLAKTIRNCARRRSVMVPIVCSAWAVQIE